MERDTDEEMRSVTSTCTLANMGELGEPDSVEEDPFEQLLDLLYERRYIHQVGHATESSTAVSLCTMASTLGGTACTEFSPKTCQLQNCTISAFDRANLLRSTRMLLFPCWPAALQELACSGLLTLSTARS